MILKKLARQLALGVMCTAGALVPAQALAEGIDLSGKTVEWVIPFSETGGSAKWANFYAPLLSEALPGQPTVVVKFMPGAGSTKGANWFQNPGLCRQRRHPDLRLVRLDPVPVSARATRVSAMNMATGTWFWLPARAVSRICRRIWPPR